MIAQTVPVKQARRPDVPTDRSEVMEQVIRHFAGVSGRSPEDVGHEIGLMGGDVAMTDKEAKAVMARLEAQYHREDLFSPLDLCPQIGVGEAASPGRPPSSGSGCVDPAEDTSVSGLVDVVARKFGI